MGDCFIVIITTSWLLYFCHCQLQFLLPLSVELLLLLLPTVTVAFICPGWLDPSVDYCFSNNVIVLLSMLCCDCLLFHLSQLPFGFCHHCSIVELSSKPVVVLFLSLPLVDYCSDLLPPIPATSSVASNWLVLLVDCCFHTIFLILLQLCPDYFSFVTVQLFLLFLSTLVDCWLFAFITNSFCSCHCICWIIAAFAVNSCIYCFCFCWHVVTACWFIWEISFLFVVV